MPIFRTARVPSARTTAATYEQLTSSPSSGVSSVSDHLRSRSRSTSDRRSSHAARSGALWQLAASPRSGEHTSELQSPCKLVCRLLLEKKKENHSLEPPQPP